MQPENPEIMTSEKNFFHPVSTISFEQKFSIVTYLTALCVFVVFMLFPVFLTAQSAGINEEKEPVSTIRFDLGGYIQPWFSYADLNPGSMNRNEEILSHSYDVSIRRFRFGGKLYLGKKWILAAGIGVNNIHPSSKSLPVPQLLDLYTSYAFAPYLNLGAGKSTWDGLSRYTSPSTTCMLFTDLPLIAQPTLNITDKTIRNLGVFVYGDIDRFNYRTVLKKPYSFSETNYVAPENEENTADFSDDFEYPEIASYLKVDLLDKEPSLSPSFKGTHLGRYHLLSVGFGYKYRHKAMKLENAGSFEYQDMKLWALDVFFEYPLGVDSGHTITTYLGYFNYDLGNNYLRTIGVNNPAFAWSNTEDLINGKGNAYPVMGTGESLLLQAGYLFPPLGTRGDYGALQVYTGGQWSKFEALTGDVIILNAGLNWHLKKYNTKISLDLQNRPLVSRDSEVALGRKNMVVLQYQYQLP